MKLSWIVSLFLGIVTTQSCAEGSPDALPGLAIKERAAPIAAFLDHNEKRTNLRAFEGDVLLVNYWATWCAPCEEELPSIGKLQATFKDKGLRVIAISVDDVADRAYAQDRLMALGDGALAFYTLIPDDWEIYYESGARGFPTTLIIDRTGKEIARLEGSADWYSRAAQDYMADILDE